MSSPSAAQNAPYRMTGPGWPLVLHAARGRLERRLERRGELTPRQTAATVLGGLPRPLGHQFYHWLKVRNWLSPDTHVPFDCLDVLDVPGPCGAREVLRLALFGLPGQGRGTDYKHREAVYQRHCAEIMREARDLKSLATAAQRVMNDREVRSDPLLGSMLRSYIAEREIEFAARARARVEAEGPAPRERSTVRWRGEKTFHTKERVRRELSRLRLLLEEDLAHYNVRGAQKELADIEDLQRRYPGYVETEVVKRCRDQAERLEQKLAQFREQLETLHSQGMEAARAGEAERALWISRRLSAVRDMLPAVLPQDRFERYHRDILAAIESVEHREALRELIEQERAIAVEIKHIGAIVHRYRKFLRNPPSDPQILTRARQTYERAVQEVRRRDQEWLASVMLRLDALIGDLDDPQGKAGAHVERFLSSVRDALVQIRSDIETVQSEQAARRNGLGGAPSAAQSAARRPGAS